MKIHALHYYMHDGPNAFRFELSGNLNREGVWRLDQDWRTASSMLGDRRLIVDMTFVTGVDEAGRALLAGWHREGALLVANSKVSRALAESILGEPLPEYPADTCAAAASDRTWASFRRSVLGPASMTLLLLLVTLAFAIEASGAISKSETVVAGDDYLQTANAETGEIVVIPESHRAIYGSLTIPISVSPLSMNWTAMAVSNNPIIRVRIRIPVSPR